MTKDDLSRAFSLDVGANGAVLIRNRGVRADLRAGLPTFSTDSREEAEALRVRHCRLARDGSGVYILNEPPKSVDDLSGIADMFRATYATMRAREGKRMPKGTVRVRA